MNEIAFPVSEWPVTPAGRCLPRRGSSPASGGEALLLPWYCAAPGRRAARLGSTTRPRISIKDVFLWLHLSYSVICHYPATCRKALKVFSAAVQRPVSCHGTRHATLPAER